MNSRYKRKLEDKRALKAQRLKAAKTADGSEREIASRLHLDGRNQMEGNLNLKDTTIPPGAAQAVPKAQLMLLTGDQPMVQPMILSQEKLPTPGSWTGDYALRRAAAPLGEVIDQSNQAKSDAIDTSNHYTDNQFNQLMKDPPWAKKSHSHSVGDIDGLARQIPKGMAAALNGEYRHTHKFTFGN